MFFHPSLILFLFLLLFSVVMMICMNSWFLIWFFIEMNLMSFIPLIMLKKSKYSAESALKYFFIQTLSSILIVIGVLTLLTNMEIYILFFIMGLSIKLGLAPFHQWLVNIVEGLVWPLIGILLTIQKVGPFILFNYAYMMKESSILAIFMLSLLCAAVGAVGGLFTSSLRKIMVFSSVSHSAWMILGLIISVNLWMIYFIFYSFILFSILYIFMNFYMSNLNHMFLKLNFIITLSLGVNMLSLGGLPPLSGFVPKFLMMMEFVNFYSYFTLLYLLLSVFISLFFYSRIFVLNFVFLSLKNMFLSQKSIKMSMGVYVNIMGLFIVPAMLYLY
uniref:NADH-ubiquinone oxidoreductase chain 2 n=1 Tax=Metacrangonyx longipes TaxID=510302 RepID=C6SNN1_9CRUS|nr:NADH dehydrogenase subunit 2 [Metacrangonyx longipes]CAQ16854.1 NADH dehydrogenase subunit 2 [Metacrangonyx longipes]